MASNGTSMTGPLLNQESANPGTREWFSNMPMGDHNPDYVTYFNDFLVAGSYSASDWVVTETDSNATEAITADDLNGSLLITNTAGATDVVGLQLAEEIFKLSVGKRLWFETKLKMSADSTLHNLTVGLMTTDTTPLVTTDSVGFRKAAASAVIQSLTELTTTETVNTAASIVDATYITLGFYWDGVASVQFFVNRAKTATHTTNIPTTNALALTISQTNASAAADTITIDYIFVKAER